MISETAVLQAVRDDLAAVAVDDGVERRTLRTRAVSREPMGASLRDAIVQVVDLPTIRPIFGCARNRLAVAAIWAYPQTPDTQATAARDVGRVVRYLRHMHRRYAGIDLVIAGTDDLPPIVDQTDERLRVTLGIVIDYRPDDDVVDNVRSA